MFVHKVGDIFSTEMPAIGHGVNIKANMSGGIAAIIAKKFPAILPPYKEACKSGELTTGGFQAVKVQESPELTILNLASQDKPGRHARLDWFEESLNRAVEYARENELPGFAIPRIGAGIGGLDWETEVKPLIEATGDAVEDLTIEVWSLPDADKPSLFSSLFSSKTPPEVPEVPEETETSK